MKIVVTGALGHIGSRVIRELPSAFPGAEFTLLDNLATQRYCSLFRLPEGVNYRFREFDVLKEDLLPVLSGATAVIHLAALTDAASSFASPEEVERVNLQGTSKVARACIEANCALFHASTTSVYGTKAEIVAEDCPESELRPQSPYAATKLREERLLGELAESDGLRYAICRFGTICGVSPGMRFHTAVNRFCWQAATGRPLTVWSTALHQRRPYLDLMDAVGAIRLILKRNLFDGEIFNVVSANLPVSAIVEMIRKQVPDATVRQVDSPAMNDYSYAVSISKIQRLGFEGIGSIADCISQTIAMLRAAHGLPLAGSP